MNPSGRCELDLRLSVVRMHEMALRSIDSVACQLAEASLADGHRLRVHAPLLVPTLRLVPVRDGGGGEGLFGLIGHGVDRFPYLPSNRA